MNTSGPVSHAESPHSAVLAPTDSTPASAALGSGERLSSSGAPPKPSRLSADSHGAATSHSTSPSIVGGKSSVPVSPFILASNVPSGRLGAADGAHTHARGGTSRRRADRASATSSLFRASATAGLAGGARPSATGSSNAVGGSSIIDLRAFDSPPSTTRALRSPMATPNTPSGSATPLLRSMGRGNVPASKILDFLHLGSVHDAQDVNFLSRNDIAFIINVSTEEYWAANENVVVYTFRIEDNINADISVHFSQSTIVIEKVRRMYYEAKKKGLAHAPRILVHCQKGRSRSPTLVLAYLIARNGWSVAEALEYVSKRRKDVEPNYAFLEALRHLQESLSTEERTKRYGLQTLLVKNISASTTVATVREFFEKRVGCVRDVVMRDPFCPAARTEGGSSGTFGHPPKASQELLPPQDSQHQAHHTDPMHDAPGRGSTGSEHARKSPLPPASMAMREEPPVAMAASPPAPPAENALFLVFFACFEDVKRAREYVAKHPSELRELNPVPGKEIRLTVPLKPGHAAPSAASSFAGPYRPAAAGGGLPQQMERPAAAHPTQSARSSPSTVSSPPGAAKRRERPQ